MVQKAIESQGVKLYVSDGGSPSAYSAIGNIKSIKGPGGAASVIDVSNLDSLAKEKLIGLPDEGQVNVELNYDPTNTTHAQLRNARKNRTRLEFKITLTGLTPTTLVFYAYVLSFPMDVSVDSAVTISMGLEVDGAVSEV